MWPTLWELLYFVGIDARNDLASNSTWQTLLVASDCEKGWVVGSEPVAPGDLTVPTLRSTTNQLKLALYLWRLVSGIMWFMFWICIETNHPRSSTSSYTFAQYFVSQTNLTYDDTKGFKAYYSTLVTYDYFLTALCKPKPANAFTLAALLRQSSGDTPHLNAFVYTLSQKRYAFDETWIHGSSVGDQSRDNHVSLAVFKSHGCSGFGLFPTACPAALADVAEVSPIQSPSYSFSNCSMFVIAKQGIAWVNPKLNVETNGQPILQPQLLQVRAGQTITGNNFNIDVYYD